jgi:hypothetical protein
MIHIDDRTVVKRIVFDESGESSGQAAPPKPPEAEFACLEKSESPPSKRKWTWNMKP